MKATYAYLAVLAVPLVVACAGGSGTVDFDGITGNEPTRSGLDGVPTTGNEAAPATVGETPAPSPDDTPKKDGGTVVVDASPAGDASTGTGGSCTGSYTCVIANQPVEFPLVSSGGKCTANGLTLSDGVVFDANNEAIGTYSAASMTVQGTVCPRTK
jgi:hypothetical protein